MKLKTAVCGRLLPVQTTKCIFLKTIARVFLKLLTDEQVFYDKFFTTSLLCQVYVCRHNFLWHFFLASLSVVCRHDAYTRCLIHRSPTYYWAQFTLTSFLCWPYRRTSFYFANFYDKCACWKASMQAFGVVAPPRKLFPYCTKVSLRMTHDWRIKFKRANEKHFSDQVLHFPSFSNKCASHRKNWQSGAYRRANKTCHLKICHRKLVRL